MRPVTHETRIQDGTTTTDLGRCINLYHEGIAGKLHLYTYVRTFLSLQTLVVLRIALMSDSVPSTTLHLSARLACQVDQSPKHSYSMTYKYGPASHLSTLDEAFPDVNSAKRLFLLLERMTSDTTEQSYQRERNIFHIVNGAQTNG